MSYFTELPEILQNLLMVRFEFLGKIFIIGFFFICALIYILNHNKKDTPYFLVALIRTWLYSLSYIYIGFTPLFILYVYPQKSLSLVLGAMFLFYRYAVLLIGLIMFINILFYAPMIIAKLGGLDIQSKNTSKVLDQWLGKYKSLFNRRK